MLSKILRDEFEAAVSDGDKLCSNSESEAECAVCLSVCPSVRDVPGLDENGLTYCHSFFPCGSPIILVLSASNIFTKF